MSGENPPGISNASKFINAKALDGRKATGFTSIRIDMENAGANVVDEEANWTKRSSARSMSGENPPGISNASKSFGFTSSMDSSTPQLLINAKALDGRKATGFTSIRIDMENAGANVVDFYITQAVLMIRG
jgi:putative intracellular protease/amidase